MNKIEPKEIFVTNQDINLTFPVYTFSLKNHIDISGLICKIRLMREKFKISTQTNVQCSNGWRSPYLYVNVNEECMMFLETINVIENTIKSIDSTVNAKVSTLWMMIYNAQDSTEWHNHGSLWDRLCYNIVLYLNSSKTPLIVKTKLNEDLLIFPEVGKLVVMHPLTLHCVPKVQDEERIVFAANLAYFNQ